MKISNRVPLFQGVSVEGQEPPSVKQGSIDSASFQLHGKRYSAWEGDLLTLENANSAYNQTTLVKRFENKSGTGLEQTKDGKILKRAENELRRVYQTLIRKVKNT